VLVRPQPQQRHPEERPLLQVEEPECLHLHPGPQRGLRRLPRHLLHGHLQRPAGRTTCTASPRAREDGAQRLVPPDDLLQRAPQRLRVQRAGHAQRRRDGVRRLAGAHLLQEPEPLLRERRGDRPGALHRPERDRVLALPAPRAASIRAASRSTVGASNSARSGSSTPKSWRTREMSCVASSEWPPSAKKLSACPRAPDPAACSTPRPAPPRRGCAARRTRPRGRAPAPAARRGRSCRWR
jgi:hypothetical protein